MTIYTTKDAYIDQFHYDDNFGSSTSLIVEPDPGKQRKIQIGFDITSAPLGSDTTSVILHLYRIDDNVFSAQDVDINRIKESWDETTITWDNQPKFTTTNGLVSVKLPDKNSWKTYNVTAMYKDAKSVGNEFGIWIEEENSGSYNGPYNYLASREYNSGIYKAYIVITYDEQETIIYGDIQDRFGSGVSNCHVTAEDDVTHIEYYDTDADGEYSVVVGNESHNYTVSVWHSGYVVRSRTIAVTPNDFNQCDFIPPSYNLVASVEGNVEDNYGNPVENAFVWGEGTNWYGCKTNANGEYALPLHTGGTYNIKACKTNFNERSYGSITQSGYHPTTDEQTTKNFTGTYCLERILGTDDLGFAVYGRSVVIPDDLPTTSSLIAADDPATTTVKLKTWKFGSGAALTTTSSGTSDSSEGEGSGGTNYKGDCGDCGE